MVNITAWRKPIQLVLLLAIPYYLLRGRIGRALSLIFIWLVWVHLTHAAEGRTRRRSP